MPCSSESAVLDRAFQCLVAGACGDALGYRIEFLSLAEIQRLHGPQGPSSPIGENGIGVVSDDTQMTLFAMDAVLSCAGSEPVGPSLLTEASKVGFLEWNATQMGRRDRVAVDGFAHRHPELWFRRAPGNTCLSALARGGTGTRSLRLNDSKGCGSVMRAAPFGMAPFFCPISPEDAFDAAEEQSFLTHGHDEAAHASGMLARLVWMGLAGRPPAVAFNLVAGEGADWCGSSKTGSLARKAVESAAQELHPNRMCDLLGEGWVADEALAIALRCFWRAGLGIVDPLDALRESACHRGDSDSTASICGNLLGAFGMFPSECSGWLAGLDVAPALIELRSRMEEANQDAPIPNPIPPAPTDVKNNGFSGLLRLAQGLVESVRRKR